MKASYGAAVTYLSLERTVLDIGIPLVSIIDYLQPFTLEDPQ